MNKYGMVQSVIAANRQMEKTAWEIRRLQLDNEKVKYDVTAELIGLRIQVLELKLEEDKEMILRFTENGVFTERERDYILGQGEFE